MAESALRYANEHRGRRGLETGHIFASLRSERAEKGDATGRRTGNDVMVCLDSKMGNAPARWLSTISLLCLPVER